MTFSIVVATTESRVIGNEGRIPWRLPSDLKHFVAITTGHVVVMGRKTYESLPDRFRPLPNRTNIVLSRQHLKYPGAIVFSSWDSIREMFQPTEEIFVIGGADIYRQALSFPETTKVHLTLVKGDHQGDTFFPEIDPQEWDVTFSFGDIQEKGDDSPYDILILERK